MNGGSTAIDRRLRIVSGALLLVHLALVGWLTLRPLDVPWVSAGNLVPFAGIRADLAMGPVSALRRLGGAVLLLAPLGVLLPVLGGRLAQSRGPAWGSLGRTVGTGAMLSLGIEMAQTAVPGRVMDVDSVLLAAVGVAAAHAVTVPVVRARLRRDAAAGGPARFGTGPGGAGPDGRVRGVRGVRAAERVADPGPGRAPALAVSGGLAPTGVSLRGLPQGSTPRIPRVGIAPWAEVLSAVPREY
ncbi:VanZ family protein [Streptomyces sp. BI20]|uniref:VanZ family protein n=1 Tax=Streptomyces sp. BI20 TaxID=3403460 RepID=UPI003C775EE0